MADLKISQLPVFTSAVPAVDAFAVVSGGTTKQITTNQILGSGGTATLASATITGALTVQGSGPHQFGTSNYSQFDQSSLRFVGSRATPGALSIYSNGSRLIFQCDTNGYLFQNAANTLTLLGITNDATQLTVNSTGLGVGRVPSSFAAALKVIQISDAGSSSFTGRTDAFQNNLVLNAYDSGTNEWIYIQSTLATRYSQNSGAHQWFNAPSGIAGASAAVTSGQSYKVSVLGSSTLAQWQAFFSALAVLPTVGQVVTATATGSIVGGGTVTQNITFTQAMTLDASGNLILLSSNTPATLTSNGQLTVNATSNTNLRFSYRGSDGTTRVANITLA